MVGDPSFSSDKSLSLSIVHVLLKKKGNRKMKKNLCCGRLNDFQFSCSLAIKSRFYFSYRTFENIHLKGRV